MSQYNHSKIDTDYFTDNRASGGDGGGDFDFIKQDKGAVMTKIEGWKEDWRIRGVKVYMSDGSSYLAGEDSGEHAQFDIAADERLTQLYLQPSGEASDSGQYRLGAIWFKTNKDREWGFFSTNMADNTKFWVDVGSGLCCGIFGQDGADVDRLGMAMLRNVTRATMDDVAYPNLGLETVPSTPTFIAEQNYDNSDGSLEQEFTLTLTETVTISNVWTTTSKLGVSESMKVSAGVPGVAHIEGTFGWSVGSESSHSKTESETKSMQYKWPVKVPPHTMVIAQGRVYSDQITTLYTGKMNLVLETGKTYSYRIEGVYDGAQYSRVDLQITEN